MPVAGEAVSSALPDVSVQVHSFSYTAFGEQMGNVKVSGFSYNAEAYDTATGMLNLRARQHEPALSRFRQKDIVRGQMISPLSLNRYAYCANSPVMHIDPSGMKSIISTAALGGVIGAVSAVAKSVKSTVTSVKQSIKNLASAANKGYTASSNSSDKNIRAAYNKATHDIKAREKAENRMLSESEKNKIFASACMLTSMKLAEMYGANSAKEFTSAETQGVYSSMIAMNPNTTKSDRNISRSSKGICAAQNRLNFCSQYIHIKRFCNKIICATTHRHNHIHVICRRRNKDNRNLRNSAYFFTPVKAIIKRQLQIQQDELGISAYKFLYNIGKILRTGYIISPGRKILFQYF